MMIAHMTETMGGWIGFFLVGFFWMAIPAIASLIGQLMGGRKGSSQKMTESMQEQLLRKRLDIANLISPEQIKDALKLVQGGIGALPMGGSSAQDPRNQALWNLLQRYSQKATEEPMCKAGQKYDKVTEKCMTVPGA